MMDTPSGSITMIEGSTRVSLDPIGCIHDGCVSLFSVSLICFGLLATVLIYFVRFKRKLDLPATNIRMRMSRGLKYLLMLSIEK